MLSPYGLDLIDNCQTCQSRPGRLFCNLSTEALQALEGIKCVTAYPKGAVLFVEGQMPSGIFVLCQGTVKMSVYGRDGKKLIVKIAQAGDVLGLSATLSGQAYELSAETVEPCQVNFVKRNYFLQFLKAYPDACLKVTEQLSENYRIACDEVRSLGLLHTADQRLAKLLVEWSCGNAGAGSAEPCLELAVTREEIGQLIGTTRETVIRILADLKRRNIVQLHGSTLVIRDLSGLREIAGWQRSELN